MIFEWHGSKARANLRKHGVSFEEAATVFEDRLAVTYPDPDHSEQEDRLLTIGESTRGRLLIVSHTERGGVLRIISARRLIRHERVLYEENR